jgi:hypothetical protein
LTKGLHTEEGYRATEEPGKGGVLGVLQEDDEIRKKKPLPRADLGVVERKRPN